MITDGDTNEMAKEFTTWYVATKPYGASTDGRRFASFDMASNGMSLQCESSWTDAHGTNGPRRYCGPSLRVELYSLNTRHATAMLARILDIVVQRRMGHYFVVLPTKCDVHGLQTANAGAKHGLHPETVVCRSSGIKYQCWFLL